MFSDEQFLSAAQKETILRDWEAFIRSGFEEDAFTPELYRHLILHGHYAHFSRSQFWADFFDSSGAALAAILLQFGTETGAGMLIPAHWRTGPGADLNEAMCDALAPYFAALQSELLAFAQSEYEREKWAELADRLNDIEGATAESAAHLSAIYELTFPPELYLNHLRVTPELRRRLADAVSTLTTRAPHPLSLFAVRDHLANENPVRQAEAVAAETRESSISTRQAMDLFATQEAQAGDAEAAETEALTVAPEATANARPLPESEIETPIEEDDVDEGAEAAWREAELAKGREKRFARLSTDGGAFLYSRDDDEATLHAGQGEDLVVETKRRTAR